MQKFSLCVSSYERYRIFVIPNTTNSMRLIALAGFILFCSTQAFPQGTLKGKIIDSVKKQPLGLATITVFRAADTAIITYRLSNPEGEFKVPGLPLGINCRAVVSFSGYRVYRKEFTLTAAQPQIG